MAIATLLIALAVPRFVAAMLRVPGDAGVEAIERNRTLSVGMLDAVINSRRAAAAWIDSGRNSNQMGIAAMRLLSLMEILPVRQPAEEARYLTVAIDSLQTGLAKQPAQPYGWSQLAFALLKRGARDDIQAAERAWRMAVTTGANEPGLILPRVAMGLVLWPVAAPRTCVMLAQEVERAALLQPRGLARLSLQLGADEFIRTTLAAKPSLLTAYGEMARLPEAGSPLFP